MHKHADRKDAKLTMAHSSHCRCQQNTLSNSSWRWVLRLWPVHLFIVHVCIFSFFMGHISRSHTIYWFVGMHHGIGHSSLLCMKGWISSARKNVIDPVCLCRCLYKPLYHRFQPVLTSMPPSSVLLHNFLFLFNLSWCIVIQPLAYLNKKLEMHMVSSNSRHKLSRMKLSQTRFRLLTAAWSTTVTFNRFRTIWVI